MPQSAQAGSLEYPGRPYPRKHRQARHGCRRVARPCHGSDAARSTHVISFSTTRVIRSTPSIDPPVYLTRWITIYAHRSSSSSPAPPSPVSSSAKSGVTLRNNLLCAGLWLIIVELTWYSVFIPLAMNIQILELSGDRGIHVVMAYSPSKTALGLVLIGGASWVDTNLLDGVIPSKLRPVQKKGWLWQ